MEKDAEPTALPPVFIRERMKLMKIRNKDVAEVIGTSEAQLSRLLSGKRKLTLEWLYAFANALNVPIESLFSPPETSERESRLKVCLLSYGVDVRHIPSLMIAINGFVQDASLSRSDQPDDQSERASRPRVTTP